MMNFIKSRNRKKITIVGSLVVLLTMSTLILILLNQSLYSSIIVKGQQNNIIYGGTVYFDVGGTGPFTDNWNPYSPLAELGWQLLFATFYYWNPVTNEFIPELAMNYSWINTTALEVWLNPNATWSDNVPVTAKDVVFTFDMIKANPSMDLYGVWSVLNNVTAVNNYTVLFTFKVPAVPYGYYILTAYPPLPYQQWYNVSSPVNYTDPNPISDGPFILYYFSPDEIIFMKNPHYWIKGLPYVNYLVFLSAPSNVNGYQHLVQGIDSYSCTFIPPTSMKSWLSESPTHYIWAPPVFGVQVLLLNLKMYPFNVTQFRQALLYALNRTAIDYLGEGGIMPPAPATLVSPIQFPQWANQTLIDEYNYSYNPQKALQLLQSIGFKYSAGTLYYPNGSPVILSYIVPSGFTDWVTIGHIIAQDFAQIGIRVNIITTSTSAWDTDVLEGYFEMSSWVTSYGPMPYYDFNSILNSNLSAPIGQVASGDQERYYNNTVNQLLAEWSSTLNTTLQMKINYEIQKIVASTLPVLPEVLRAPAIPYFNATVFIGWPNASNPYVDPSAGPGFFIMFEHIHLNPKYANLASVAPSVAPNVNLNVILGTSTTTTTTTTTVVSSVSSVTTSTMYSTLTSTVTSIITITKSTGISPLTTAIIIVIIAIVVGLAVYFIAGRKR